MTAVGKILVWLNLVFSLVVGGFVVFAYVARTQWVAQYNSARDKLSVAEANVTTYRSETEKVKQEAQSRLDKVQAELKSAQEETRVAQAQIVQLNDDLTKLRNNSRQESALSTKFGSEVEKRQNDVGTLREALRKEQEVNNNLVKEKADLQNRETVAQIERRSVQEQNTRLVKQLEDMAKDMARMRANGGSRTVAGGSGKNPPPDNVEGLVKDTDASGLMTLTIGSDSGLTKGHTLELFRIGTSPSQSKYLGTVRILEAEAKQSVAQPTGRLTAPPQRGDHVASRILGG
jgi:multidrug efflux pump subunit AcrA (membrane-fusion protein)